MMCIKYVSAFRIFNTTVCLRVLAISTTASFCSGQNASSPRLAQQKNEISLRPTVSALIDLFMMIVVEYLCIGYGCHLRLTTGSSEG